MGKFIEQRRFYRAKSFINLPLLFILIFFGIMFKGRFFGPRTYSQMMDENIQRLNRIEGHLERMAISTELIATELKALANRLPDRER
jgi:hypothetical protein